MLIHAVFFIRNSNFFQAASFLIFREFEPASFLISFLNSLPSFEMLYCDRLVRVILLVYWALLMFLVFFIIDCRMKVHYNLLEIYFGKLTLEN